MPGDDCDLARRHERRPPPGARPRPGCGRVAGLRGDPSFLLRGARLEQLETWAAGTDLAIGRSACLPQVEQRSARRGAVGGGPAARPRIPDGAAFDPAAARFGRGLRGRCSHRRIDHCHRGEPARTNRGCIEGVSGARAGSRGGRQPGRRRRTEHPAGDGGRRHDPTGGQLGPSRGQGGAPSRRGASRVERSFPGVGGDHVGARRRVRVDRRFRGRRPTRHRPHRHQGRRVREVVRSFPAEDGGFQDVDYTAEMAFSADGSALAIAGNDGALQVFNEASGDLLASVPGLGRAFGPSLTADGSMAAAAWDDGRTQDRLSASWTFRADGR